MTSPSKRRRPTSSARLSAGIEPSTVCQMARMLQHTARASAEEIAGSHAYYTLMWTGFHRQIASRN